MYNERDNVSRNGFVPTSYWDQSVHLMTLDKEGNQVDCYDRVVDDLNGKEDNVVEFINKEKRKNKYINILYNMPLKGMIISGVLAVFSIFLYFVFVILGKIDIIYSAKTYAEGIDFAPLRNMMCQVVDPMVVYVDGHSIDSLLGKTIVMFVVIAFISLLAYLFSRDNVSVRWITNIIGVKPLCKVKEESDNKVQRLESDLYKLQLRKHRVKFATHDR